MSNIKALQWRYAVKKFDAEKILPEAKIDILKQAFNLTATSYGLQPIRLVVVKNKELQESLKEKAMNQVQLSTASHVLVICIEDKVDKDFILNYFERVKQIRETPDEILDPFKNFLVDDFGKKSAEDLTIWAKNQAYLVLGTLLTVCATEEIDACPMEGFLPEEYDELLNLKEKNLKSVLVLPVGYRAKDDIFSSFKKVRRPEEDTIINIY
ncbi:NAD(P)H-dependent oxidoreductase [Zunongwangia sp. SCSIO 43204]|uniref:NAD(P)H-dependent oxidoreductase n=1 Tax=Zunongwangia sp. SCSIO 43204 TaxID=2779359 RepID=UPI001CA7ECBA|nr:NAD(P)H-dependent oxidoreductase [Zunongwangia sp. SCSIO 43204]UAB83931.1 NAD(P)H-dependent oxidoreductase [Zunongwangia sp. SCSIO 43204]